MIVQPQMVTDSIFDEHLEIVTKKKNLNRLKHLRFTSYVEGKAAQIMHIGPFSEEGPTVQKVHDFIDQQNYQLRGKHHEIYLSDIRRADPANWKTVIRQPFKMK